MRAKEYEIMVRAIEEGVDAGWIQAHKHDANPGPDEIKDAIVNEVINAVCECFDFDAEGVDIEELTD